MRLVPGRGAGDCFATAPTFPCACSRTWASYSMQHLQENAVEEQQTRKQEAAVPSKLVVNVLGRFPDTADIRGGAATKGIRQHGTVQLVALPAPP